MMTVHKFDRDANVSYATLMREAFEAAVKLARTIERELGVERAHEILYKSRVEGDLAMVAKQMEGQPPIKTFADFKKLMKGIHENRARARGPRRDNVLQARFRHYPGLLQAGELEEDQVPHEWGRLLRHEVLLEVG